MEGSLGVDGGDEVVKHGCELVLGNLLRVEEEIRDDCGIQGLLRMDVDASVGPDLALITLKMSFKLGKNFIRREFQCEVRGTSEKARRRSHLQLAEPRFVCDPGLGVVFIFFFTGQLNFQARLRSCDTRVHNVADFEIRSMSLCRPVEF